MVRIKKSYSKMFWIVAFLYAFYALKTAWLAFFSADYFPLLFNASRVLEILCVPFAFLLYAENKVLRIPPNLFLIILPLISWSYVVFYHYEDIDVIRETFILLVLLLFVFFPNELKRKTFDIFYWIVIGTSVISIFVYMCYVLGIDIGFKTEQYYRGSWATYIRWLIFAIYQDSTQIRLCGIFNEPGGLGTVCALLFAVRYKYSRTWEKIVLLLSIFFSFSMAGYILVAIYYIIGISRRCRRSRKNIVYLFGAIFIGVALLLVLTNINIDFGNKTLNKMADRFAIVDGQFAGDNRSNEIFDKAFAEFLDSDKAWFGYGTGYLLPRSPLGFRTYVVEYGLIGSLFWLSMWLVAGWEESKRDADCIIFLVLYALSLYQRPALIESIYGYVLLFGGIQWLSTAKKEAANNRKLIEYSSLDGEKGVSNAYT